MTREVSWDKSLRVYEIAVSATSLIEAGANVFRMETPKDDPPETGSRIAVIDPDGWRVEAEVIPNPTPFAPFVRHPGCVELFLLPVAANPMLDPAAIPGRMVNGKWEPTA